MKSVQDLKVFVPAENYSLAKQFYLDLAFSLVWEGDELAAQQCAYLRIEGGGIVCIDYAQL